MVYKLEKTTKLPTNGYDMLSLNISGPEYIFGSLFGHIFHSLNKGKTWEKYPENILKNQNVRMIKQFTDPFKTTYIAIGDNCIAKYECRYVEEIKIDPYDINFNTGVSGNIYITSKPDWQTAEIFEDKNHIVLDIVRINTISEGSVYYILTNQNKLFSCSSANIINFDGWRDVSHILENLNQAVSIASDLTYLYVLLSSGDYMKVLPEGNHSSELRDKQLTVTVNNINLPLIRIGNSREVAKNFYSDKVSLTKEWVKENGKKFNIDVSKIPEGESQTFQALCYLITTTFGRVFMSLDFNTWVEIPVPSKTLKVTEDKFITIPICNNILSVTFTGMKIYLLTSVGVYINIELEKFSLYMSDVNVYIHDADIVTLSDKVIPSTDLNTNPLMNLTKRCIAINKETILIGCQYGIIIRCEFKKTSDKLSVSEWFTGYPDVGGDIKRHITKGDISYRLYASAEYSEFRKKIGLSKSTASLPISNSTLVITHQGVSYKLELRDPTLRGSISTLEGYAAVSNVIDENMFIGDIRDAGGDTIYLIYDNGVIIKLSCTVSQAGEIIINAYYDDVYSKNNDEKRQLTYIAYNKYSGKVETSFALSKTENSNPQLPEFNKFEEDIKQQMLANPKVFSLMEKAKLEMSNSIMEIVHTKDSDYGLNAANEIVKLDKDGNGTGVAIINVNLPPNSSVVLDDDTAIINTDQSHYMIKNEKATALSEKDFNIPMRNTFFSTMLEMKDDNLELSKLGSLDTFKIKTSDYYKI